MHSHYAQEATSYANMQLSVHERIDDLHKRAYGLAPAVADSGCSDKAGTYRAAHKALGPRQRMAWNMIAEAHGWNAISDSPAMLAEAERREAAGEPYFVGYENTKPAEFTTALATETNVFEFGVWGHDQPLELLPADDARETAELHYHDELRHYSDGDSIAVIPCTERHESANPAQPQSCGCWNATHLGSCIHQPADPWSAADLAASNAAQPQRAPWAVAEDFPQRASYVPAQPADCRCSVSWGSCPAHSHAAQPATPERAVVTLTLSDQAAGCPVHGADPCFCSELLSEEDEPTPQLQCCGVWIDYPKAGGAAECLTCHSTFTVTAACPDELVSCEECSAPCDGTLTAWSELFGEDMPVCPDCYRMCQLMDAVAAMSGTLTAAYAARHAGELWDIPASYVGRHRCSVI